MEPSKCTGLILVRIHKTGGGVDFSPRKSPPTRVFGPGFSPTLQDCDSVFSEASIGRRAKQGVSLAGVYREVFLVGVFALVRIAGFNEGQGD